MHIYMTCALRRPLSAIRSTSSLCSLKPLVHGNWLTTCRVRKVREPSLTHAQQQLRQESGRDDVIPTALTRTTGTEPRLGRCIGVSSPKSVKRQDLLRDHRDCGQGHVEARHESDKVLLLRRRGLPVRAAGSRARGAARRGHWGCLRLDCLARLVVEHEREVNRRNGDHVRWVEETDLGAIRVVDDEPASVGRGGDVRGNVNVPRSLQRSFLELEFSLSCSPVPRTVVNPDANFTRFGVKRIGRLSPAEGEEGAVRVEHDEVTLEVAHEIELHLCELRVVRGKVLDAVALLCSRT